MVEDLGLDIDVRSYRVETEDGYFLKLHRLVKKGTEHKLRGQPILFQHGLGQSSECYVLNRESIAVQLLEKGYDVWLGNNRGTKYSKMHRTID